MALTQILNSKSFDGYQKIFSLNSNKLLCETKFSIYLPPNAEKRKVPVLYWLSGLHSNHEIFIQKAGAQRYASEHGVCIVCPDTAPRNINISGKENSIVNGVDAGFYLDATKSPWSKHYKMFSYITSELINVVNQNFPVIPNKQSIAGFSMGGHGALICALKNPGLYSAVSALEPIANLISTHYGQKIYAEYLGDDETIWREWDATELVKTYNGVPVELFIDQGTDDKYYIEKGLLPENLINAATQNDRVQCIFKLREGYDHSYYYVASVIEEHIKYHSKLLNC